MISWNFIFYLFASLVFLSSQGNAQSLKFDNYTGKNGLLTDEILKIHQDREGYIWVFSKYGTLKYNGLEFKPVLNNLKFYDRNISCLYENSKGEKWFVNSNGKVFKIRNDSAVALLGIKEYLHKHPLVSNDLSSLYIDNQSNLYVLVNQQILKFINSRGEYQLVEASKKECSDSIFYHFVRMGEKLWPVLKWSPCVNADGNKVKSGPYLNLFKQGYFALNKACDGGQLKHFKEFGNAFYFICQKQLVKISKEEGISYFSTGAEILNYEIDAKKHVWVATLHKGIFEFDDKGMLLGKYLSNMTINDILVDTQGGVWAASDGAGLFHCRSTSELHFSRHEPLGSKLKLLQILNDTLLVVNAYGEIFGYKYNQLVKMSNSKIENLNTMVFHNQHYLIAKNQASFKSKSNSANQMNGRMHGSSGYNEPHSVAIDTLIYGFQNTVFLEINHKIVNQLNFENQITDIELVGDVLYVATSGGVFRFSNSVFKSSYLQMHPAANDLAVDHQRFLIVGTEKLSITDIASEGLGSVWFATGGEGLFHYQKNELIHYPQHKLPADIVHHLSFNDGSVFLSTNAGLFSMPAADLNKSKLVWKLLYAGEVKKTILFENKLYLSTLEGLVMIEYEKNNQVEYKNVYLNISGCEFNGKSTDPFKIVNSANLSNTLAIKLDCISFSSIKPKIKYHLSGPVSDSGIVSANSVKFNGLLPGHYTLRLRTDEKFLNPINREMHFVVHPSFLQSKLFKVLALLLILILGGYVFWLYKVGEKLKNEMKQQLETYIAEYKLIALKAQVNPHFMSNCLSAIQALVLKNDTVKASYYISQFGMLARKILEYSEKPLITLKEELEVTRLYIKMEQLRFDHKFKFDLVGEKGINSNEFYVPPLILNPIVENAIWHGLLPLKNKKGAKLKITVSIIQKHILVKIKDNGVGRRQKKSVTPISNGSFGTNITEQRIQNINYLMEHRNASLVYHDHKNRKGDSLGTEVEILLPIILNPSQYEKNQNLSGG